MAQTSQPSPTALLRYQVVSELRARLLGGMAMAQAVHEVKELPHFDHRGRRVRLSERSIYRWAAAYELGELSGLEPRSRPASKSSRVLPRRLITFLKEEKKLDTVASVPELIERARLRGILAQDKPVSRTTVWRACRRMGLPLRRGRLKKLKDMRRFAYPHRMMMVLADGKHFRAGEPRCKRVAIHLLDDATRFGLGVLVGSSEQTMLFLGALHKAIRSFGLMLALYLDNGPGFISEDTRATVARLGIHLIHGTAGYAEGHGKIERFHRTLIQHVLRSLDGNPQVDPDPAALTLRLNHWLREVYNHRPHESLGGATPAERFLGDDKELNMPGDHAWLNSCFQTSCERRVSADNVVRWDGEAYEVPLGHAGSKIRITRHLLDTTLSICHEGRQVVLHPVDLLANAYSRRAAGGDEGEASQPAPAITAGSLRHLADLAPIVDADGNFPKGDDHDEED